MKRLVVVGLLLYLTASVTLYLASFFHFYGSGMWNEGAILETWKVTTKFVLGYVVFYLFYTFMCSKIRSRLLATAITTISIGILLPWVGYSILTVIDIAPGEEGMTKYISWLMVLISNASLLILVLFGRKYSLDNQTKK